MSSVTGRSEEIKQPYGGYLKPSSFIVTEFDDNMILNDTENIEGSVVGLVVDYLSRLMSGIPFRETFKISLSGLKYALDYNADIISQKEINAIKTGITGLDDISVINACKLASFDIWSRNYSRAKNMPIGQTNPDKATIQNIQTMVKRSLAFFEKYGPIVETGFHFAPVSALATKEDGTTAYNWAAYYEMMETRQGSFGGYTPTVEAGEGDYLTRDTLWEFKVIKSKLTSRYTLQLLMYWIMGQHSGQEAFKSITKLGVFNPRLNKMYLYDIKHIPREVIQIVEKEIICYD